VKELGERLPSIALPSSSIKIAITGLSRAGKTVFITSLIDQLLHQNKLLGVTASNPAFKVTLKAPIQSAKRFDYYTFINQLKQEHIWPKGTDEISHTVLEFESKSHFAFMSNSTFTIELIDYPGEWLLDLTLLEMSFEQWSEKTISWLREISDPVAQEYLKTIDSLNENIKGPDVALRVHTQYKELLIHLKKEHYSQLTPGRFIMPSDLANDPMLHFAPIGSNASGLTKVFNENYTRYVKEVVKDIHLEHFKGFERQVVLVDVIEALQNGYECYRDMKAGLQSMLHLYDHKNKNFFLQWLSPSIKKVLFVATKADQVAASQHANFSMLLEDMIEGIRHDMNISHIKTDTQIVASLKSTMTIEKNYEGMKLSFIRGILAEDSHVHDLYPGEMPSKFPTKEEWNSENYGYKSFLPPVKPYRENESLEHINMDKLVSKLIGDLL
jgi:hypothetical protein